MTGCAQCFGFAPALSRSAGQDGPRLYPGPLCGGEAGSKGRAAGADRDVGSFSPGQDALSKSPAPAHGLAAHGWAASAKRGGLSLWLLSLWPRKEKVTRLPKADESSCSEVPVHRTKASRASALLQGMRCLAQRLKRDSCLTSLGLLKSVSQE